MLSRLLSQPHLFWNATSPSDVRLIPAQISLLPSINPGSSLNIIISIIINNKHQHTTDREILP
jgi:hypothetical protein